MAASLWDGSVRLLVTVTGPVVNVSATMGFCGAPGDSATGDMSGSARTPALSLAVGSVNTNPKDVKKRVPCSYKNGTSSHCHNRGREWEEGMGSEESYGSAIVMACAPWSYVVRRRGGFPG